MTTNEAIKLVCRVALASANGATREFNAEIRAAVASVRRLSRRKAKR